MSPEDLARLFHETYERLAPEHGYETRKASAVPWEDVPPANKSLMVAVAGEVLPTVRAKVTEEINAEVSERVVNVCEQVASSYVQVLERVLNQLGLSPEQRARVPAVVTAELRAIAGGGLSWSPVDGCQCLVRLGHVPHDEPARGEQP